MKKSKKRNIAPSIIGTETTVDKPSQQKRFWSNWSGGERIAAIAVCLLVVAGTFGAGLNYLKESAREQKLNSKNSSSKENTSLLNSVNPFVEPPLPTSTPQLSKEYLYAGSRMLAVEDANASAVPPADLAVWRPASGYWYVYGGQSVQWGGIISGTQDVPVPGDFDGDGRTDISVYRPNTGAWYIVRSSDGSNFSYSFGATGDTPAPADYDGDGKTDAAVVRKDYPSSGQTTFFIQFSSTSTFAGYQFGINSDKPTSADFDGDGKADLGVWRNSDATFYFSKSSTNYGSYGGIACGATGDTPVPADYDGDGRADAAVRNGGTWKIVQSSTNTQTNITWNYTGSVEVQNDYDGDGKVDIAVWDGGTGIWSIRQSASLTVNGGLRQVQWGGTFNGVPDIPVPAFYRR